MGAHQVSNKLEISSLRLFSMFYIYMRYLNCINISELSVQKVCFIFHKYFKNTI